MEIVELRRVRGTMIWWGGIIALLVILSLIFNDGAIHVDDPGGGNSFTAASGMRLPLALLAPFALYIVAGFATPLALALNRESVFRDISWTKPVARPIIALRHIAIDAAGIVVAFVYISVAISIVLGNKGVGIVAGDDAIPTLLLALGGAMLWYALLLALTAGFSPRASFIVGIMWPIALICSAVQYGAGGVWAEIARVLNVVNPFAYLSGATSSRGGASIISLWNAPIGVRAAIVWSLAIVLCAIAATVWSRREA